ncbi:MAG: alpha/beta hydrolase-fold protein [Planctomycetota bacterium]
MLTNRLALRTVSVALLTASAAAAAHVDEVGTFDVTLDPDVFEGPFSGKIFVAFAKGEEPRSAMHGWFGAPPVLRFEVVDAKGALELSAATAAAGYPIDWTEVAAGEEWEVQVVARRSRTGRSAGLSPGDVYSDVASIVYDADAKGSVELRLDRVVEPEVFEGSERVELFEFVSPSLSEFHGFEYTMRAGVRLPASAKDGERHPVLYSVTGFGGTYDSIFDWENRSEGSALDECIVVVPDASNLYGHSVFCDSDSIGPWGKALVHELIPALEAKYGGAGPKHRYVTGGSSGGWSALWLQVAYPAEFAGCWSHVPDPIDFHDFQQINLYEPLPDGTPRNMYVDESGERRPLARRNGQVMLYYEDFARREHVLNPGGQIRSFDATFSPLGEDGTPRRVFDIKTGVIDHEAAQAWRRYDISHTLLTRWDELEPQLDGKIRVFAGEVDSFYLEGAVERFVDLADEAGLLEHMQVEVVPGLPHTLHRAGYEEMIRTIGERWRGDD